MTQAHALLPLGSVVNTLTNQNYEKAEPIDYTADESMIADFMAVLPQLDPSDSSSTATSPTLKMKGQSNDSSKCSNKFDELGAGNVAQQQVLSSASNLSTGQSLSPPSPTSAINNVQLDYSTNNNKRKRKTDRPSQKRIRGSYKLVSPEQKVRIHEYAEKHGVKAASKLFQVAPSTIASWLYQKPNGERTSAIRNKEAHARILDWIQTRQENGERVYNRDFHSFALQTMRELTGNPDFAASRSWCSNFLKKYNIHLDSDKQTDSTSNQYRFDFVDENASESSQCYMGGNSPADLSDDDDDPTGNHHHQVITQDDSQTSPHSDQTINPSHSLSPSQTNLINGTDDVSVMTTSNANKCDRENGFGCLSPLSPSTHATQNPIPAKITLSSSLPFPSSSSNSAKRLNGTLNRLLNSMTNRSNGHTYHHQNGLSSSSSPSASSSTMNTTNVVDSTGKETKTALELSTQSIESFVQHFESSFNTMTYFQEKLQQLLVSIAQERDTYRTLYLNEHDRRIAAELRLKENNNAMA